MTLLLDAAGLDARRQAAAPGAGLAPLADALASALAPLVTRGPWFPPEKARMTRYGGRCAVDGTLLEFDPWSPRLHRCARCGATYDGEEHYRWWLVGWQLWLAERAVHAALLHRLRGDDAHARLADAILDGYTDAYLRWPNADNVLGPTRPFFSTYLESIWLLQLCVAADLRRGSAGGDAVVGRFIDRVVVPSVAIVGEFDEGLSNRQTWNAAALLAAARLTGDDAAAERHALGPTGVAGHLARGLLADGSWYEGENYHLFAHRALWFGVALAERAGIALPDEGLRRFRDGFAVPFLTALPDFTFPARRDAQHRVSLRQWRFAELCELGLARHDDARLSAALRTLYDDAVPLGDTARDRSTGEAERNVPAARLTRADLGWKSLLAAGEHGPATTGFVPAPASVLLEGQGLAVVRREAGRVYVSLDYGHSGGGHGHPDRLNLTLHDGDARWLDDVGTGSYTDPSLHWYRSTLAHNAPLLDGHSQSRADGRLVAWEERGGAGWVEASFMDPWAATLLVRTVVVMPDYLVDVVSWRGAAGMVDVPVHADGELHHAEALFQRPIAGGAEASDGFPFVSESAVTYSADEAAPVRLDATCGVATASAWFVPSAPAEYWRLVAPGPPYEPPRGMHVVRCAGDGERGSLVTVWSWRDAVREVAMHGDDLRILTSDGVHAHRRTAEGWHVDLAAAGARSSLDLGGLRAADDQEAMAAYAAALAEPDEPGEHDGFPPMDEPSRDAPEGRLPPLPALPGAVAPAVGALVDDASLDAWRVVLGEDAWRRTEQPWERSGAPTAALALAMTEDELVLEVRVRAADQRFAPATAFNPLDNEHPDVNSAGLQLYLGQHAPVDPALPPPPPDAAWILVPEAAPRVRVTPRGDEDAMPELVATWAPSPDGWAMRIAIAREWVADAYQLGLHVVVNEMPLERERRRGQLVLGGARGEWGYLRGDREAPERLVYFDTSDA